MKTKSLKLGSKIIVSKTAAIMREPLTELKQVICSHPLPYKH